MRSRCQIGEGFTQCQMRFCRWVGRGSGSTISTLPFSCSMTVMLTIEPI
jgi:hypothetical protein